MSKKDCIMKGYDIEATNALLSNGMAEDIDDDVSSINLKKEESFVHMTDEHTYNPLVTAGSLEVNQVVYDGSTNHRLRVIDVKDGDNSWTKTITWKDLEDNRIFTTNPGVNALFELKVEGDKEFEVDDDIDFEFHPIDTYFENFTEDMDSVTNEEIRLDIVNNAIDALHDMGYDDDFIGDYVHIEVKDTEDGRIKIEVRGEFNYEELSELSDRLNKVVSKYDKYAYFDMEDSGIASAYILKDQSDYVVSEEVVKAFAELIDACETREDLKKVYTEHIRPSVENDVINTATLDGILNIFDKKLDAFVDDETINESTLNEGPGAGYIIKSSGYDVNGKIVDVKYSEVEDEHYTNCKLDCKVNLTGKVQKFNAEGAYAGTGDVQYLPIKCDHVYIEVPKGTLEDWKVINSNNEIGKTALLDLIIDDLRDAYCSFTYGGGWSHATYDGQLTDDDWLDGTYYWDMKASIYLSDEEDIKKVDRMTRGYGYETMYDVIDEDGDAIDSFEDENEAIEYAKKNNCSSVERVFVTIDWDGNEDIEHDSIVWENEVEEMDEKLNTNPLKDLRESDETTPYTKEEVERELKSITHNFTDKKGELKCGFEEEKNLGVEILKQHYKVVEVSGDDRREGTWYHISFAKPKLNEELEKTGEDGWSDEVYDILDGVFTKMARISYEVRNTVRGVYVGGDTVEDLVDALKGIKDMLDDAIDELEDNAERINESTSNVSEKLNTSTKTFSQWFDETQRHDSDEFYPFSNYAKTFESAKVLKDATAMDIVKNAHKFYDVYPVDSSDREKAFLFASKELGIKYDDLYDAWLSDTPVKLGKYESINESRGNDEVKNMTSDELETAEQKISSANTSINSAKLPVIFNKVRFNPGELNLDFGGGKFDNATEYLAQQGVESLVYDPYNRTAKHNAEVLARVRENGGADTITLSNVLNVIAEPEARLAVLRNCKKLLKSGGTLYITVYEGTGKGDERETKAGYQLNRKTADYIDEIASVFSNVTLKGKLIIAK